MNKVVLGLSGGVDSAVAAHLLRESGLEVYGLYLDNGLPGADAAREAAASLSVPLVADIAEAMEKYVCAPFAAAYLREETPNPVFSATRRSNSVLCWTRHSASERNTLPPDITRPDGKRRHLPRTAGKRSGNTLLCRLTPDEVNALRLPLAPYKKTEVRALAEELKLPAAHKPDSMDICFIPDGDYAAWIEARGITPPPGDFVLDSKPSGKHRGIHHYTVGQRRHFGVGFGKRVYVSDICPETNEVRLSSDDAAVWRESFRVRDVNWLVVPEGEIECGVRIRHSRRELPIGTVTPDEDGALIDFPRPVRAPTPARPPLFTTASACSAADLL